MGARKFVDINEVYSNLTGTIKVDEEVMFPLKALYFAVARSTTLVVPEPQNSNDEINNKE